MRQDQSLFTIRPMTAVDAHHIAAWRYDEPYAFYNMDADPADCAELLSSTGWGHTYWSVDDSAQRLIGFFQFQCANNVVELGLGLRPDTTGQGRGAAFVRAGLTFAQTHFAPCRFRLAVAAFNQRAIRVYTHLGFVPIRTYLQPTNGGLFEFLEMERGPYDVINSPSS